MKRLGPVLTLIAGAAMAVVLGVLSAATAPPTQSVNAQGEPAVPAAEATSEASPEPKPTKTVKPVPAKADYAGRVQGNGGLIAISIRNGKAIGYFCDGKVEAWLKGRAADGRVTLSGPGKASVVADLGGGKAAGTLEFGAKEWDFTAPTVKKPSGLYRASAIVRGAQVRAGWIYLPDGSRVGLTVVDDQPVESEIPEPGENATVDGVEVDPQDVDEFIEGF
ncbi:hypothetical protein GCM10010156_25130 [Planobispora rosea]|uniref:Serine/threonine protein kinase n=1 Tax=Planobispora rosea TaxID=35762 RepID=A0A8J3WCE8_PLARO|nr:hypothetical protein [Planobispora rosea]GGS65170.1 hypothetical protein GCM10010156_25130 [Planobispora rosea]GIH84874.1 hypothetical protein Pro02_32820 [Planobispora rosea]